MISALKTHRIGVFDAISIGNALFYRVNCANRKNLCNFVARMQNLAENDKLRIRTTLMQMDNLQNWVEGQMMRGRYIFSKRDVHDLGLPQTEQSLWVSFTRLINRGTIMSPWQNFYVAIPMEYRLKGEVPPSFYIDSLMRFLKRDYYVALSSAAALNGAGHQRAMAFQVVTNGAAIRSGIKNGTKLEFIRRKELPMQYVKKVKVQTGYINVSTPELTALDLVCEEERIGGLSRAAEMLMELAESMTWDNSKLELLKYHSIAVVQRLGYLLDLIEENALADALMTLAKQTGKTIRKTPLKKSKPISDDMETDAKWKIIINQTIDLDEI